MTDLPIAILGAGPIGLDAALAAIDAGLDFRLYEAAPHPAGGMRRWGHVRLFTPWELTVSQRMARHLAAAGRLVPGGDTCPTADEVAELLLDPIAGLPEIAPRLESGTRVLAVGREGLLKHEEIASEGRAARPFRLLVRGADGRERIERARVVIDCTGTYSAPNTLGDGGIPAPGEVENAARILRHIPDPAAEPGAWAGKRILVVGAGHSAQTAICDLAAFAEEHPGTDIVWALRHPEPRWRIDPEDPLPERSGLTERAARLAAGESAHVETLHGVAVEAVAGEAEGLRVTLRRTGGSPTEVGVDLVLALTGYTGDASLYRQLQVHECYATSGPMKLAAALQGGSSDCLAQESHGAETLTSPEPGFFILGIKSYGRSPGFLMRIGYRQVDEAFSLLAAPAIQLSSRP
jgi:thioredoxin reductase